MNVLMSVVMIILNVIKTTGDCPSSCECKWKSGKESVVCVNVNMTEIPKHLDSGTQVLDLTGNRLHKIGADEFFNASLLNLQKIYLSKCRLRFLDRCSFRKIINLVELDLSFNDLHSVPSHTFEFIRELRELKLSGNPIIRVLNGAFKTVPRLTKLDLSECRIGYVEVKAFQGLENSLEWLKLDKNKITNIKAQVFINLKNLNGLELTGNTWNCSCELRTLREWMLKQNVPYSVPPTCSYPSRLTGKLWDKLELDEFACTPRIEAVTSQKNGEEGSNVTLSCSIDGVPEPSIRWLRRNHVIANLSGALSNTKQKLYIVQITKRSSNLTISAADVQDNGVYVCRAENKAGKSEANITLTVTVKSVVKIWSSKMITAVGMVSLLLAVSACLLMYCAWNSRKRKPYFRNPVSRRELIDGYEMNQKKTIIYNKIVDYGNLCPSATNISNTSGQNSRTEEDKNGRTGIGTTDDSESSSFLSARNCGKRNESTWNSSKVSDTQIKLNERVDSESSPESHSFRSKGRNRSISSLGVEEACLEDSPVKYKTSSSSLFKSEPLYLRTEKSRDNATYYTSALPETPKKIPDLLELSRNEENLLNNNLFLSIPRKRGGKMVKIRRGSFDSESQSPLLPGSSGDSCDSNYLGSRRTSIEKIASSPTSPVKPCQTPILNLLDGSHDVFAQSPTTLKYKSWELETFLKECRNFQDELYKMKESCDILKEDNLKFRRNSSKLSTTVESATISKLISPCYSEENFYELNKKFLDETNNFGSLYSEGGCLENNNNSKSILRNKSFEKKPLFNKSEEYWSNGRQYLSSLSEPNSGKCFYQS